jgi:hypothetical protein
VTYDRHPYKDDLATLGDKFAGVPVTAHVAGYLKKYGNPTTVASLCQTLGVRVPAELAVFARSATS